MREKIYTLLESPFDTAGELLVRGSILGLIVLNGLAVILQSMDSLGTRYQEQFLLFQYFSVGVFTIEYFARIISCTVDPQYQGPVVGRLRFALRPIMLIDLLATLPAYLPLVIGADFRILRILRVIRVFRLFKLGRYSQAFQKLSGVVSSRLPELAVTLFGGLLVLLISSTLLYYLERDQQPDEFSSIPASAWVAVSTLTPVGSGGVGPITPAGKLVAALSALVGVGIIALPAGILARALAAAQSSPPSCPHCGKDLHPSGDEDGSVG